MTLIKKISYKKLISINMFSHSYCSCASTASLLSGFFVESTAANWMLKDLIPPLAAGYVAMQVKTDGKYRNNAYIGAYCGVGSLYSFEFFIPTIFSPEYWLAIATCSGICKMACYLLIGSVRAQYQKELCDESNDLGEFTTKIGSMGMTLHSIASASALMISKYLDFKAQVAALITANMIGLYSTIKITRLFHK